MKDAHRLHIISDSTGETIAAALRATVPMFQGVRVATRRHVMIRNEARLQEALETVAREPGPVFHTVIEPELRRRLETRCAELGVIAVPFLDPLLMALERTFGLAADLRPGAQHAVDERYYARMEALDFAMAHDDGNLSARLREADVVLVGVSRTSKTPTCVYLAGRGLKAANVPLVPGRAPPPELFEIGPDGPLLVGLTARPKRLSDIRRNRITALRHGADTAYADREAVTAEVREALRVMDRLGCPVIDVTRRSIEETAAAIRELLEARRRDAEA